MFKLSRRGKRRTERERVIREIWEREILYVTMFSAVNCVLRLGYCSVPSVLVKQYYV